MSQKPYISKCFSTFEGVVQLRIEEKRKDLKKRGILKYYMVEFRECLNENSLELFLNDRSSVWGDAVKLQDAIYVTLEGRPGKGYKLGPFLNVCS